MRHIVKFWLIALLIAWVIQSCEKEVDVDIPAVDAQVVVEGSIEPGQPPFILVSWSQGFFDPLDIAAFNSYFIHNAEVRVNGVLMEEVCSSQLPDSLLPILAEATGIALDNLFVLDFCVYSNPLSNPFGVMGEVGGTYELEVKVDDHVLTSTAHIPAPVLLEELWYKTWANTDSLGLIWARITDPDTLGNAYRWFAKRINQRPGEPHYTPKDFNFHAPLLSAFDDEFFNGTTFEVAYGRGRPQNSSALEDNNAEAGLFKDGDTVVVKWCSITPEAARAIRSLENQVGSTGNPFASPANVQSLIDGGLGFWIGYGVSYDTIPCFPE